LHAILLLESGTQGRMVTRHNKDDDIIQ
jgi:hypothetical protein